MKVYLLTHTPAPERVVAAAARLCYSQVGVGDLHDALTDEQVESLLTTVIARGHLSVLEHASFTFGIEDVSRVLTHQLVRHRLASYSQQSQRHVKGAGGCVLPPSIEANPAALDIYQRAVEVSRQAYAALLRMGIHQEDCRYILPAGTKSKIVVTMNARELLHVFEVRCCLRAQWEIRALAYEMLKCCQQVAPRLFARAGAPCESRGDCPEQKRDDCERFPARRS